MRHGGQELVKERAAAETAKAERALQS
jgi:hypothetical protein